MGIGPGTVLEWNLEGDRLLIRRVGRYRSTDVHRALFPTSPRSHSLAELKEGVQEYVRRRHARR